MGMGVGGWMRVVETVSGLVQMSGRLGRPSGEGLSAASPGALGGLEARLAGVVVAALKEAFDRDRARMELERTHLDAERQRAEEALRAELRRQAADRALGQIRLVALIAAGVWMLSAALTVLLPNMRSTAPLLLMGGGWAAGIGALGCAFSAWQHVSTWSADAGRDGPAVPVHPAATAAPWLLLSSLTLTGAALLAGL